MITSRGLVEGDRTSLQMLTFADNEAVRSVQLYGIDPVYIGKAVEILCAEHGVGHVDLNFGCPVPKVTRKGGGAALPWKSTLLGEILTAAVAAAEPYGVPVTMKTRKGIDDDHLTYLDAGRIAQDAGCAAIGLHGRTAAQHYSGRADWDAIAALKDAVDIPVLGQRRHLGGRRRRADDGADRLRRRHRRPRLPRTSRGCSATSRPPSPAGVPGHGRRKYSESVQELPTLGEVAAVMRRHAELLGDHLGEERGCVEFRKHVAWYLKGFAAGSVVRERLGSVSSYAALDELLALLDPSEPYPVDQLGTPRGRQGTPRKVVLPDGWLRSRELTAPLAAGAEDATSGG